MQISSTRIAPLICPASGQVGCKRLQLLAAGPDPRFPPLPLVLLESQLTTLNPLHTFY